MTARVLHPSGQDEHLEIEFARRDNPYGDLLEHLRTGHKWVYEGTVVDAPDSFDDLVDIHTTRHAADKTVSKLDQQATIEPDADNNTLDTQLRLALADALALRDGTGDLGGIDCLIAHFERLFELWTVDQLLNELVKRAGTHDGVNDDDLTMGQLLTAVEKIANNIAYWSRIDKSYTPEVAAYIGITNVTEAYAKAKP